MTKRRNGRVAPKRRKKNPMTQRVPRIRLNERNTRFDGQFGNFRAVGNTLTAASNVAAQVFYIDCTATAAMGQVGSGVAALYSEYVYESCVFRWLPSVSPGVSDGGSQIYIAYFDNPEKMAVVAALSATNAVSAVKAMKNAKFFNAWEQFTYSVPLTRRRKSFDVNVTNSHGADVDDRSVQGMVLIAAESIGATPTLGRFVTDSYVKFMILDDLPS